MTDHKLPPVTRDAPPMPACKPPKVDSMTLQDVMLQLAEDVREAYRGYWEIIDSNGKEPDLVALVAAHLPHDEPLTREDLLYSQRHGTPLPRSALVNLLANSVPPGWTITLTMPNNPMIEAGKQVLREEQNSDHPLPSDFAAINCFQAMLKASPK